MNDDTTAAQPDPPCNHPHAAQFDFWLGEWDLAWGEGGRGSNSISKIMDGCVILEQFDSAPSDTFRGMSVSTYNARQQRWQQTWVDNAGNYLDFAGGFEGGRMVLSRTFQHEGKGIEQRMVWYNIGPGGLDWNWERAEDGGDWQVLWHIHYRRRAPASP